MKGVYTIYAIIFALVLVTACAQPAEVLRNDVRVQQFLDIYPDAKYSEQRFTPRDPIVNEFLQSECDIEPPFIRATYKQWGASLIAYVQDDAVPCVISKIDTTGVNVQEGDLENAPEGVALTVNGEPIMFNAVQASFAALPEDQQNIESINGVVNQLVTQELLRQEAHTYDVDVDAAYAALIDQSGLDAEAFSARLAELNVTEDAVRSQLEQQLQVQALLDEKLGAVDIDDAFTKQFYLDNTDAFIISEQVTFQQIFIAFEGRTEEQAVFRAQTALRSLNTTDFCTVVKTYSDDADSIERCGVYTIPRGVVVPVIEQAAFSLPVGQVGAVQSDAGIHILNVISKQESGVVNYNEAADQVRGMLENQVQQLRLNAYLASLQNGAVVVSYLTVQQNDAAQGAQAVS